MSGISNKGFERYILKQSVFEQNLQNSTATHRIIYQLCFDYNLAICTKCYPISSQATNLIHNDIAMGPLHSCFFSYDFTLLCEYLANSGQLNIALGQELLELYT